jgi:glyoxylase-like metal-dependent hydrolase (beta-lactamase superfamily II)
MTKQRVPSEYWPTDTFSTPKKELFINGEGIQIIHEPAAHTDGDTIIFFRRSDVISTGDVFIKTGYPVVDIANGGSINGIIKALNEIIDLAIPREKQEGGTMIIPGHGRLCDEADVVEYRDMLTIIRDRVQDMIKKGMTLEQVEAARPTLDYDPLYGSASGPVTTKMFVENVYYSLSRKQ